MLLSALRLAPSTDLVIPSFSNQTELASDLPPVPILRLQVHQEGPSADVRDEERRSQLESQHSHSLRGGLLLRRRECSVLSLLVPMRHADLLLLS